MCLFTSSFVIASCSALLNFSFHVRSVNQIFASGNLPVVWKIVGVARSKLSNEEFREQLRPFFKPKGTEQVDKLEIFLNALEYQDISAYDKGDDYGAVDAAVKEWEGKQGAASNRLLYLALPPSLFEVVTTQIKAKLMNDPARGWSRIIIEKPFGKDLASSNQLSTHLSGLFTEEQIYRIDHYLGKEMVQNMTVMRFSNQMMKSIWCKENIECVRVTFKEPFGTGGRGGYFDEVRSFLPSFSPSLPSCLLVFFSFFIFFSFRPSFCFLCSLVLCVTFCKTICCKCCAWSPSKNPSR